MTDAITVTPSFDFRDLRMERTPGGHIVSPWFSYDYERDHSGPVYGIGSHFHSVRIASISAFAQALNIQPDQVMVTERKSMIDASGHKEWRLGTKYAIELPKPKQLSRAKDPLAIDV